jgi:hypothetical protein
MFKAPVALNTVAHGRLRLKPTTGYGFAKEEMLCPLVFSEIERAAREFVIVFPKISESGPQALLGTAKSTNSYVGADGRWLARYIPVHFRRYPFVAGTEKGDDTTEQKMIIMIDEDAPQLDETQGKALFTDEGRPSEIVQRGIRILKALQEEAQRAKEQVGLLEHHGLLIEQAVKIERENAAVKGVGGFRLVNSEKLRNLQASVLGELHQSGALQLAYAHKLSLTNLRDGWLAKKPVPVERTRVDLESVDTLDFDFG